MYGPGNLRTSMIQLYHLKSFIASLAETSRKTLGASYSWGLCYASTFSQQTSSHYVFDWYFVFLLQAERHSSMARGVKAVVKERWHVRMIYVVNLIGNVINIKRSTQCRLYVPTKKGGVSRSAIIAITQNATHAGWLKRWPFIPAAPTVIVFRIAYVYMQRKRSPSSKPALETMAPSAVAKR